MSQQILGQLLKGRYQLTEHLSAGGMGAVYKGEDTELFNRPVAVKLLHQHLAGDEKLRRQLQRRFAEEARVSTLLGEHPLIIKILDYGLQGEQPYLVMEYLAGCSLGEVMKEGPMDPLRVAHLGQQICAGMYHAHSFEMEIEGRRITGVIHRDIKPSNIFVLEDKSQRETIKILDFGIAKVLSDASMALGTQTTGFLGTARYASPEQMRGEDLDARSDIYSLGIVLYRMVVGELPIAPKTDTFAGWYQSHHRQSPRPFHEFDLPIPIPAKLSDVVLSCLEKEPENRPQTMRAVAQGLAAVLATSMSTPAPQNSVPVSKAEFEPVFSENTLARVDSESSLTEAVTSNPAESSLQDKPGNMLSASKAVGVADPIESSLVQSPEELTAVPTATPLADPLGPTPAIPPSPAPIPSGKSQNNSDADNSRTAGKGVNESRDSEVAPVLPGHSPEPDGGNSSTIFLTDIPRVDSEDRDPTSPPRWQFLLLGSGLVAIVAIVLLRQMVLVPSLPPVPEPEQDLLLPEPLLIPPEPISTPTPSPSPSPEPSPSPAPAPATPVPVQPVPQVAPAPPVNPVLPVNPVPQPATNHLFGNPSESGSIPNPAPRQQETSGSTLQRIRQERRDR